MSVKDDFETQITERAAGELTRLLMSNPEKNLARAAGVASLLAGSDEQKRQVEAVRRYLKDASKQDPPPMGMQILRRAFDSVSPNCRSRLVMNLAMWMRHGTPRRDAAEEAGGCAPLVILMSPTMRCNLRCTGCYAAEYDRKDDLPAEVVERVVNEAKDLGTYAITLLGGEPFIRDDVLDLFDRHPEMTFQVFTNGTLVTDEVAHRLSEAGNVIVSFSIDGSALEHDMRRGQGTLQRTERGMAALRAAKVPFGSSTMVTSKNYLFVTSDEFVDYLVEQGCLWGWHFLYMPIGGSPDLSLMPTPAQREYLRVNGAARIRNEKPLFVMDFWNDAPYVGGCIAGREYIHVNSKGDVEPCIFAHFATDNVKDKSLAEIMKSQFFSEIRSRQPYDENLLRPCMLIDNTHVAREVMSSCEAHPTHQGAEELLTSLADGLDSYAAEYKQIADEAWIQREKAKKTA